MPMHAMQHHIPTNTKYVWLILLEEMETALPYIFYGTPFTAYSSSFFLSCGGHVYNNLYVNSPGQFSGLPNQPQNLIYCTFKIHVYLLQHPQSEQPQNGVFKQYMCINATYCTTVNIFVNFVINLVFTKIFIGVEFSRVPSATTFHKNEQFCSLAHFVKLLCRKNWELYGS